MSGKHRFFYHKANVISTLKIRIYFFLYDHQYKRKSLYFFNTYIYTHTHTFLNFYFDIISPSQGSCKQKELPYTLYPNSSNVSVLPNLLIILMYVYTHTHTLFLLILWRVRWKHVSLYFWIYTYFKNKDFFVCYYSITL